ncbi:helix-turn-helix family protein [Janthinobacterium agaricidamnosum NBRC 102515 = DSM 9628]|uniref:Helix-turn-helix family protein n=2 Tax=Janthinobacterium agaricidamnosum TaxID=55508 RepID=W0VFK1_9BURK|nr:helix-turn-helix family protein [Janthinobacterium agaricidamnosum NBRC 102515 = DSM 9628]
MWFYQSIQMKKPKTEMETEPVDPAEAGGAPAPEDGIGDRIRSAREGRGLSQTALAARTKMVDQAGKGVARTVLVGYESGNFRPGAREIRLLCQALSVTPNWLLMGDELASDQASLELVRRRDWRAAVRLAMAISILKTHERSAFQSLVLSLAGRQLGDMGLSSLLTTAAMVANATEPELRKYFGEAVDGTLEELVLSCAEGLTTNVGNKLLLDEEEGDVIGGEWLYPDPGKVAK